MRRDLVGLVGVLVLVVLWACVCVLIAGAGVAAAIGMSGLLVVEACMRLCAWARGKPGPGLQDAPHAQPVSEAPIVDELERMRSSRFHWQGGGPYAIESTKEKGTP